MADSSAYRLATAAQRRQAIFIPEEPAPGMPKLVKTPLWQRARQAYFNATPISRKERLAAQMDAEGVE